MPNISFVSVNIERSRHLDTVVSFLQKQKPDIVAMQEVIEEDIPFLEKELGMECFYTRLCYLVGRTDNADGYEGQAFFAKKFLSKHAEYYAGEYDPIWRHTSDTEPESIENVAKALSYVEVEKEGVRFRVATTHFTWSVKGKTTERQRKDMDALLLRLEKLEHFVIAGDFNASRGGEIFSQLAARYTDNIPAKYIWSIDTNLHRRGKFIEEDVKSLGLPGVMVDGLFTTPDYTASDVELHPGVSDHMAITATISKQ